MLKVLRAFLILSYVGGLLSAIVNLNKIPLLLILLFLLYTLLFICFWKGTTLVTNNPEEQTVNKWIAVVRWILLFIFSVVPVELGIIVSFLLRFLLDQAYVEENLLVINIIKGLGPFYSKILMLFGLSASFLPLLLISNSLKFTKPIYATIITIVFWAILIFGIGSLLGSK